MLPTTLCGQHQYLKGSYPELDKIQPNELSIGIRSTTFFRNNEYNARSEKGYTLPGARLSAFSSYTLPAAYGAKLSLGLSGLYYFGASRYPAGIAYSDLPYWTDHNDYVRCHLLPYIQALIKPSQSTVLILGNIVGGTAHGLIDPIFNPELDLTADPEMGVQFRGEWSRFRVDTWVNWLSMIFKNDNHQESFVFGLSSATQLIPRNQKWQLELPVQIMATHRGGEYNWSQQDTVHTWINAALGLKIIYHPSANGPLFWGSLYAVGSALSGGYFPYDRGGGFYTSLGVDIAHFTFRTDYWYGDRYVSPFAAPFANSLTFDKEPTSNEMGDFLHLYAGYSWGIGQDVSLIASAQTWFQPFDSFAISHALSLTMTINPNFIIRQKNKVP